MSRETKAYSHISQDELLVFALKSLLARKRSATFEDLVAECFTLFPAKFGLLGYPDWPNAAVVNKAWLRCRTDKKLITGSAAKGFELTQKGEVLAQETMFTLRADNSKDDRRRGNRQTIAGRFVKRIETSRAYHTFLKEGSVDNISEYDMCDLLYATTESLPDTLIENYDTIVYNVNLFERLDLLEFLKKLHNKFPAKFARRSRGGMMPRKSRSSKGEQGNGGQEA